MKRRMLDMLADANHLLSRAKLLRMAFEGELNRVAEGELKLTDAELEELQSLSKKYTQRLEALGGVVKVVQPVEALVAAHRDGQLPDKMREAYELLYCRSYGTGALYLGDVTAEKIASANSSWAVKSDKTPHRSGATRGKSPTAHKRNIVQDAGAYDFKRRVDKKLSRIATEIRQWLAGEQSMLAGGARRLTCPKCGRIADMTWKVCPIDGHRLKEEE